MTTPKTKVTIERMAPGRKNRPARWRVHAEGTFTSLELAHRWAEKQGLPKEPQPGWAIRIAWLP